MATDRPLDHFRATIIMAHYTKAGHMSDSGASSGDTEPAVEDKQLSQPISRICLRNSKSHTYSTAQTSQVGLGHKQKLGSLTVGGVLTTGEKTGCNLSIYVLNQ